MVFGLDRNGNGILRKFIVRGNGNVMQLPAVIGQRRVPYHTAKILLHRNGGLVLLTAVYFPDFVPGLYQQAESLNTSPVGHRQRPSAFLVQEGSYRPGFIPGKLERLPIQNVPGRSVRCGRLLRWYRVLIEAHRLRRAQWPVIYAQRFHGGVDTQDGRTRHDAKFRGKAMPAELPGIGAVAQATVHHKANDVGLAIHGNHQVHRSFERVRRADKRRFTGMGAVVQQDASCST
ncbi:MAG: hypothetical protein BWX80_02665 [Candidatus Hydrogenedentes bacterium ADurb.Bin101]|nr:MAG: hypothetical protein BWX80_02665 [Candidatus Hydrogenedentes bacterium ADurb.Bin101]